MCRKPSEEVTAPELAGFGLSSDGIVEVARPVLCGSEVSPCSVGEFGGAGLTVVGVGEGCVESSGAVEIANGSPKECQDGTRFCKKRRELPSLMRRRGANGVLEEAVWQPAEMPELGVEK